MEPAEQERGLRREFFDNEYKAAYLKCVPPSPLLLLPLLYCASSCYLVWEMTYLAVSLSEAGACAVGSAGCGGLPCRRRERWGCLSASVARSAR